jgi:hypothetical protein
VSPRRLLAGVVAGLLALGVALTPVTIAAAEVQTSIAFDAPTLEVGFAERWTTRLTVTAPDAYITLDEQHGTVDLYVDGATEPYLSGLHVFRGGAVYASASATAKPLDAGTHTLTAIFRPAADSGLVSGQTASPLQLVVAPTLVDATASIDSDDGGRTLHLAVAAAEFPQSGVLGTWHIAVSEADEELATETIVVSTDVLEAEYDLAGFAEPGRTLTIVATFEPVERYVGGFEVSQPESVQLEIEPLSFGESLAAPIVLPWWALIALVVAVLGLAVTLIVLVLRSRRIVSPAGNDDALAAE